MLNLNNFEVSNYGNVINRTTGEVLPLCCKDRNIYVTINDKEFGLGPAKEYIEAYRNKEIEVWSPMF
jgi:hypothetical protein